ncbi:MAG TPA: DUF935 family protein [Candidatus Kapabacteria bacterium]|nr:DUF935 family protein [Candidatus Kapabacteria bacterium]
MFDSLFSGYANNHFISSFINKGLLPNPDKLLTRLGSNFEAYRDLKTDAHIWSCIQSRKSGSLALEHYIENNTNNEELSKFIEMVLTRLDFDSLQNNILEAIFFGFQVIEIIWDYQYIGDSVYLLPQKLISKQQELFAFGEAGELLIKTIGNELEKAPIYKYLLAINESNNGNPYGEAILSKCYWYALFKNGTSRFWINYAEKYGSPMLLAQFQRGASQDEAEKLADALAGMSQDSVIVSPSDYKIDIAESNRSASVELFKELIKFCNSEISKAILSETLTTEMEGGSFAAAEVHYKIRKELIKRDSQMIRKVINTLIQYIIEVNNLGNEFPRFIHIINDADNISRIDRDIKLFNAGIKLSKEYWKRTYGLKNEDFDEQILSKE